jgi:hypothetical protein
MQRALLAMSTNKRVAYGHDEAFVDVTLGACVRT